MKQNWKYTIKNKLKGHEVRVPDDLWDGVMNGVTEYGRKRLYVKRIFLVMSSCVTVAAMLILFLKVNYDNDVSIVKEMAQVNSSVSGRESNKMKSFADSIICKRTNNNDRSVAKCDVNNTLPESVNNSVNDKSDSSVNIVATVGAMDYHNNKNSNDELKEDVTDENASQDLISSSDSNDAHKSNTADKHNNIVERKNRDNKQTYYVDDRFRTGNRSRDNGIVFGLSVQNLMSSASALNNSGNDNLNLSNDCVANNYANVTSAIGMLVPRTEETKTHHNNPFRASLSIAFPLTSRVYIESGLVYSYHSSDIQYINGSYETDAKQSLHYIGVPMNLLYRFIDLKRLNVYVVGGGAVEKMVYGRQKVFDETYKVKIAPLQLSVHMGGGMEYKFNDNVGVFVEPNMNYYFKNKTSTSTIYQDRPWTPDIKIGIRILK